MAPWAPMAAQSVVSRMVSAVDSHPVPTSTAFSAGTAAITVSTTRRFSSSER